MKDKISIQKVKLDKISMVLIKSFGYFVNQNNLGQLAKLNKLAKRLEGCLVKAMSKIVKVTLNCNPQCGNLPSTDFSSVNTVYLILKLNRFCFAGRISEQIHRYLLSLYDINYGCRSII
jgi:hypothetical protein